MAHKEIIDSRLGYQNTYEYRITREDACPNMLTVEFESGRRYSISYSILNRMKFEDNTIQIFFSREIVEITGSELGLIFHALTYHRLAFVRVSPPCKQRPVEGRPIIDSVSIRTRRPEKPPTPNI